MAMTGDTKRLLRYALPVAVLTLATVAAAPAWADVFDDARHTFTVDMPHFFTTDFPHFFQDDIPCAFGGQPTSGTKASCNAPRHAPKHAAGKSEAAPPPASSPGR